MYNMYNTQGRSQKHCMGILLIERLFDLLIYNSSIFLFLGKQNGATILELKHNPPLSKPKKNHAKYIQNLLILDEARATSIQDHIKNYKFQKKNAEFLSEAVQLPLSSGVKLQTLNYVTTIKIGSTDTTVIVDTGSDLTWVSEFNAYIYFTI